MSDSQLNKKLGEKIAELMDNDKYSHEAKLNKIRYLIRIGADVNAMKNGMSLLALAKRKGWDDLAKLLKEKGAKEIVFEKENKGVMVTKPRSGVRNVTIRPRNAGVMITKPNNGDKKVKKGMKPQNLIDSEFLKVCRDSHNLDELEVDKLLKSGANKDVVDLLGRGGLVYRVVQHDIKGLEYLIEKGADVNIVDEEGLSPLHIAVICDAKDAIDVLLKNGADVNIQDIHGWTPIVRTRNRKIAEKLLENGANLDLVDELGCRIGDKCNGLLRSIDWKASKYRFLYKEL